MFDILINEGPLTAEDNAVYTCSQAPTFEIERVSLGNRVVDFKFLVCIPSNSRRHGNRMRIPFDRIVSISER